MNKTQLLKRASLGLIDLALSTTLWAHALFHKNIH
jgi:hypothetical protein